MPVCPAMTAKGTQCTAQGNYFEYHCLTHHKKLIKDNTEYKARFDAKFPDGATELEMIMENRRAEAEVAAAAEEARQEAARIQRRQNKINRNMRTLAEVDTYSPMKILNVGKRLMTLWRVENVPNYDIPKAYAILAYRSPKAEHYTQLLTACIKVTQLANGYHPDHDRYADVPHAERTAAHDELHRALDHWETVDLEDIMPAHDPNTITVRERREALAAQAAAAAEAAAAAARRAEFEQNMRQNPIVFRRDPEGGIDLRAFANDRESVHRSSVQNATQVGISVLMKRPLLPAQDTLAELVADLNNPAVVKWTSRLQREACVTEVTNDYFITVAFGVGYCDVLDHAWAFIKPHEHHKDMVIRLAQEIYDGRAQCVNGKMARLINALIGFDEEMTKAVQTSAPPPKELLQGRMAVISTQPREEREAAARILFAEFHIPMEEQAAWLDPLLEV